MELGQHVFPLQIAHFVLGIFCFALLLSFSARARNHRKEPLSILFMAFSIVMWLAVELARYLFDFVIDMPENIKGHQKWLFVNIFSSFNNALVLAALPIFKETLNGSKLRSLFRWKDWMVKILAFNIIVVLVYITAWMFKNELGSTLVAIIDYIYSAIVISLFLYGAIHSFIRQRSFPRTAITTITLFSIAIIVVEFIYKPIFGMPQEYRFVSLYISHLFLMIMMLLTVVSVYYFDIQQKLKLANTKAQRVNKILELQLKNDEKHKDEQITNNPLVLAQGRYLSFFKKEKNLVVELTLLDKGILKLPIYCSSVNREYKDFLRFAVHMKAGKTIKAHGGAHSGFGDIYKAILDIRNRLLNKHLKELGHTPLKANELIVQRIKGSGSYELDCRAEHIEIDVESLSQVKELRSILSILTKFTNA